MFQPKTIKLSCIDNSDTRELVSYLQADDDVRKNAACLTRGDRQSIRVVVLFTDLFVWTSTLSLNLEDARGKHFVQRAIRSDWEFNAGVRPAWWPNDREADRIWGVHYREDRDNGRAELARMRLDRYDLAPVVLSELPPRDSVFALTLGGRERPDSLRGHA
jgi:hypothetical protein